MKRFPSARFPRMAVLALAMSAACGPHVPLNLAVQEVPLDILLGAQQSGNAARQVITIFLPAPETAPVILPPGVAPLPSPSPAPCPSAPPGTDPLMPASADLIGEPQPGVYSVRTGGAWQPDVTRTAAYAFPSAGTMTITKPVPVLPANPNGATGEYTYSVTDSVAGQDGNESVTTDYLVVPTNSEIATGPGTVGGTGAITQAAGIFIQKITTSGAHGTSSFTPSPPITYINLPLAVGVKWTTSGSDATSGTTMQLSSEISASPQTHGTGRYRVDACGQVYDSWEVHATGTLVGPGENLTIDWYYDVATQFGGIELRHVLAEQGQFSVPELSPTSLSVGRQVVDSISPSPVPSP